MSADRADRTSWSEWITAQEPAVGEAFGGLVTAAREMTAIAPAQRELTMFAVSCALRIRSSSTAHARRALELGSTRPELLHAVVLAALSAGLPAAVHGVGILRELPE